MRTHDLGYVGLKILALYFLITSGLNFLRTLSVILSWKPGPENIDGSIMPVTADLIITAALMGAALYVLFFTQKLMPKLFPGSEKTSETGEKISRDNLLGIAYAVIGIVLLVRGIPLLIEIVAFLLHGRPISVMLKDIAIMLFYVITGSILLFGSHNIARFFGSVGPETAKSIKKMRKDFSEEPEESIDQR